MTEGKEPKSGMKADLFDLGGLFRNSGTITFVVEILSVIVMIGALAAYGLSDIIPVLNFEVQVLLLLIGIIVTLVIFLAAFGIFVRFSRRISDAVIGPGIQEVRMDTPRVKAVVYTYAILVLVMAITGIYAWWLADRWILAPWAGTSLSLRIFGFALGAFVIALLIQIIVAAVGRTATKVIIEVLDADDEEFLD